MPLTLRPTALSSPAYRDWADYIRLRTAALWGASTRTATPCQIRWLASKDPKSYGQILAARPRMSDSEAS